jgi:hypothetical protein
VAIVDDVYDDNLPLRSATRRWSFKSMGGGRRCDAQYFLGKLYRDGGLLIPNSELARMVL